MQHDLCGSGHAQRGASGRNRHFVRSHCSVAVMKQCMFTTEIAEGVAHLLILRPRTSARGRDSWRPSDRSAQHCARAHDLGRQPSQTVCEVWRSEDRPLGRRFEIGLRRTYPSYLCLQMHPVYRAYPRGSDARQAARTLLALRRGSTAQQDVRETRPSARDPRYSSEFLNNSRSEA